MTFFLAAGSVAAQQNSVSIGTQAINDKAVLMLVSPGGNQGLIVPLVTNKSVIGATASEAGMVVFDRSDNKIYYWNGTTWIGIGDGAAGADDWGSQVAITEGVISGTGLTGDPIKLSDGTAVNQTLVWDGSQWNLQTLSTGGTVTSISTGTGLTGGPITNTGTISVATGGITSNEILDNSITGADISTATSITANSFTGDGSALTNVDAVSIQGQLVSATTPTSGQVLQYTGGQWLPTTLAAGDITAVNTSNGITGGATSGDVNLSLSNTGNGQILIGNGTTVNSVTISGDATLGNTGTLTLANTVTSGTYTKVTVDSKGRVTSGSTLTASDIPTLTMAKISDAGSLAIQSSINLNQIVSGGATGGQILQFNSGTGFWEPVTITTTDDQTASEVAVTPSGNLASTDVQSALTELQGDIDGLGSLSLSNLSDALITTPSDGNILVYNTANTQFENTTLSGDAIINSSGLLTIADDAITLNKIADNGANRAILANNASGNVVWLQPSGVNQLVGTDGSGNLAFRTITTSLIGGGTGIRNLATAVDANLVSELAVREALNSVANSTTLADNVVPRASSGTFVASAIRDDGLNVGIQTNTPQTSLQIGNTMHLFPASSGGNLLTHNVYESSPGSFNYTTTDGSSVLSMQPERIGFFTFQSGTADATLGTFSMRMNFTGDGLVINGDNLNNTAILDINSTSKGILIPRMTTAQRNIIGTPANGLLIYNTSTSKFNFYDGSATSWATMGDDLGNHTATTNLDMASNAIRFTGAGANTGITITGSNLMHYSDANIRLHPNTGYDVIIYNNATEYARFEGSTQSLGIGTTAPQNKLDVEGSAVIGATYSGTNTAPTNGLLVEGSVGIGTTSLLSKFQVEDNGTNYVARFYNRSTNTAADGVVIGLGATTPGTGSYYLLLQNGGGIDQGSIRATGSGGVSFNTTSDRRLKQNICDFNGALDMVNNIRPRAYQFKAAPEKNEVGFIAQELLEVFPQAVSGDPMGNVEEEPMMVDYSKITPVLTGAIKELNQLVKDQKQMIEKQQTEIAALKELFSQQQKAEAKQDIKLKALEAKLDAIYQTLQMKAEK
ncbi:hypothetical protein C900_01790 [Fulvivirga imtechensis AK7]|uniref:Peptidase S74 domain-containing protein n=1 Tax=Fulvivirga imtechensis AK7 TaxID=1237149 RepID=L8JTD9_9BACT|nr:hypothetical protein C900_01790 [Fulvivirga imtechensis AK7]